MKVWFCTEDSQKRTGITVRYWPSAGYIAASSEKAFAILVRAPVSCDQW
jgi:hypothetical protein